VLPKPLSWEANFDQVFDWLAEFSKS